MNILVIKEDKENYYFKSINQCDIKVKEIVYFEMFLPQSIMNITLPTRLVSWYKKFVTIVNNEFSRSN